METLHPHHFKRAVINADREAFDLILSWEIEHLETVSQFHLYSGKILIASKPVGLVAGMVTIRVDAVYSRLWPAVCWIPHRTIWRARMICKTCLGQSVTWWPIT